MSEEPIKNHKSSAEETAYSDKGAESSDLVIDIEEMVKAGVYFGHKKSKRHPKMKQYIFAVKNNIDIIDLQKTAEKLKDSLNFIQDIVRNGGDILFVGTKAQAKGLIKEAAESLKMPYLNERWLGGFITNFPTMLKRIEYFNSLRDKKESGEREKYTKKEKIKLDKELKSLENKFGGVKDIKNLPKAIFVLDLKKDLLAANEARKKGIPVVAICDTNANMDFCDFAIPANDDAISSVKYILDKVKEAILNVRENKTT